MKMWRKLWCRVRVWLFHHFDCMLVDVRTILSFGTFRFLTSPIIDWLKRYFRCWLISDYFGHGIIFVRFFLHCNSYHFCFMLNRRLSHFWKNSTTTISLEAIFVSMAVSLIYVAHVNIKTWFLIYNLILA